MEIIFDLYVKIIMSAYEKNVSVMTKFVSSL